MEKLKEDFNFWRNRRVFITGHTGFKGGWTSLFLSQLGAKVYGYSLAPKTKSCFFEVTRLKKIFSKSYFGNILDSKKLSDAMKEAKPSIIIHMAAQSLVLDSYKKPIETFSTNVIGTANILEVARYNSTVKAIVNVTTDKCYENREITRPYKENDRLGGADPYSSSKACAELVTNAFRMSFFTNTNSGIYVASARAGNVIGGGDWSANRIIPDFFKALDSNKLLLIRHPKSVRPWQHVLDPVYGYLILSKKLVKYGHKYAEAWNFGPNNSSNESVLSVINNIITKLEKKVELKFNKFSKHLESRILNLDISKAKKRLRWLPKWNLDKTLKSTVDWHEAWKKGKDMKKFSIKQINEFYSIDRL